MDANAAGVFDDADGDLDQTEAQRVELGSRQNRIFAPGWRIVCISQYAAVWIINRNWLAVAGAGGTVRGEVQLVRLDQVLGLAALAIDHS